MASQDFEIGDRVRASLLGEGTVEDMQPNLNGCRYQVHFDGGLRLWLYAMELLPANDGPILPTEPAA